MNALLANILVSALLPPFCLILMGVIGLAVWRRRPRLGRNLVAASFALLWVASTTALGIPFMKALGWPEPVDVRAANGARAIVVLGGGLDRNAPEYGGADTVNSRTLDRVRYGAWLVRQTGLPVLVSGGRPDEAPASEAEVMKSVLENEFLTPVRWVEVESQNTFENARASARILRAAGIGKVFLVTDSFHMRRAVQAFAPTGIEVVPAPVNLFNGTPLTLMSILPSPVGFQNSYFIAHELLGRLWYAIRERFE
jgi:uncharacterized SAM-binding protein YcdF (DUF218 family)